MGSKVEHPLFQQFGLSKNQRFRHRSDYCLQTGNRTESMRFDKLYQDSVRRVPAKWKWRFGRFVWLKFQFLTRSGRQASNVDPLNGFEIKFPADTIDQNVVSLKCNHF